MAQRQNSPHPQEIRQTILRADKELKVKDLAMTNKEAEAIELLEKIDKHIIHHTCGYTVTQDLKTLKDYVNQAIALLRKEQPPASDFTAIVRKAIIDNGREHSGFYDTAKLLEACTIIDTSEASRKDLLDACELGLGIAKWTNDVSNVPKVLKGDIRVIEAAIAKAKKEG